MIRYMSKAPAGSVSPAVAVTPASQSRSEFEWKLSPVSTGGREYLLDMETNFVYFQPRPTEWLKAVGKKDPYSGQLKVEEQRDEKGLFAELDQYLKNTQTKFKDMFSSFAVNNRDSLDIHGLARLLRKVQPNITDGEIYYFQVMLDVDGDGQIEYDEFMETVKVSLAAEKGEAGGMSARTRSVMDSLASTLFNSVRTANQVFNDLDAGRKGSLAFPDFARFLSKASHSKLLLNTKVMPNLQAADKRSIVAYLNSLDLNHTGHISFTQLMRYMSRAPSGNPSAGGGAVSADYRSVHNSISGVSSAANYASSSSDKPPGSRTSVPAVPGRDINASVDGRTPWILRELKVDHDLYLLDIHSSRVYSNMLGQAWPELVGTWDGYKIHFNPASSATTFFQRLDQYLKSNKVALKDLFSSFDRGMKGFLSIEELRLFIRKLMPEVAEGDLKYFQVMIDQDGDNRIRYDEFLTAAREAMEDEKNAANRDAPRVQEVLKQVSEYMIKNRANLRELFDKCDTNHNGALEPPEVMNLFKKVMPSLKPQEVRYLLAHLHKIDQNHDGVISFNELLIAMKAVDFGQNQQSGAAVRDYRMPTDVTSPRQGSTQRMQGPQSYSAEDKVEWNLEHFKLKGQPYLLDRRTGLLYVSDEHGSWPRLVGKLHGDSIESLRRINPGDLFQRLDEYLKAQRMRLREVFDKYDRNGDGELSMEELSALIREQMPQISRAELLYFQAMMDIDGNGRVSYNELIQTAKDTTEAAKKLGDGRELPKDVRIVLDRVSQMCITSPGAVRRAFEAADHGRRGSLDPMGVAFFLRKLFPEMSGQEVQYLLQYLSSLDVNGDGLLSYSELMTSLHAVTPKTDSGGPTSTFRQGFADTGRSEYGGYQDTIPPKTSGGVWRPVPFSRQWYLEEYHDSLSRKLYLYDRSTSLLYSDVPATEWPALIAQLVMMPPSGYSSSVNSGSRGGGNQQRVEPLDNATATTEFFMSLDGYLKGNKVHFRDLFNRYDRQGRGKLDIKELKALVREFMPKATDAQIWLFQIILDENGDRLVTEEEFLKAAGEALRVMRTKSTDPAVARLLDGMSSYLFKNAAEAARIWEEVDHEGHGYLHYLQIAEFFKKVDRRMTHEELTHLMSLVHTFDVDHKGQITFQDVLRAVRAVELETPRGKHARGFRAGTSPPGRPGGTSSGASAGGGGRSFQASRVYDDYEPWVLEAYARAGRGREFLVDMESGTLYTRPKTPSLEYPAPVGRLEADSATRGGGTKAVLYNKEMMDAFQFFKALDAYLKDHRVHFNELFQKFDRDRSGHLDSLELRNMIHSLMPHVTEAQLRYFQAMLDCGGDVSLTQTEFLTAAKQCLAVEGEASRGAAGLHPDVAQALRGLSAYIIKNKVEAREAFLRYDCCRSGRLEPRELLQLLRHALRHPLSDAALRHVSVQLYLLFMDGDGTVSFRELIKALRGVELQTPDFKYPAGQWQEKKRAPQAPVLKQLTLAIQDVQRKRYYIDHSTNTLYEPITRHTTWPKAVGTYDAHNKSVTLKPQAANSADLFSALDTHLKKQRKHFSEVFDKYDANGNGTLERTELAEMIKGLLGSKVTPADIGYFQAILDLDGSNAVSEDEFMSAAREYVDLSRTTTSVATQEVKETLKTCSKMIAAAKDAAYEEFQRLDSDGDGKLGQTDLAELLRVVMEGRASNRQIQFLLTWIHNYDVDKSGLVTFNEILVALHAVPVVYPGGRIEAGNFDPPISAKVDGPYSSSSDYQAVLKRTASSVPDVVELKDVRLGAKTYLADEGDTGYVYEMSKGVDYPEILGRLDDSGRELLRPAYSKTNDLFVKLTTYLKKNQTHLKKLFDSHESNQDSKLDTSELQSLLTEVMPEILDAEIRYFQVMMDADGDGSVSYKELVQCINECHIVHQAIIARDKQEVIDTLIKVSIGLRKDKVKAQQGFEEMDRNGTGKLDPADVALCIKRLLPQLNKKDIRHLMSYLHFLDIDGDGCVSYKELAYALHVPDLKLPPPSKAIIKGGQFKKAIRSSPTSNPPSGSSKIMRSAGAYSEPLLPLPEVKDWRLEDYPDPDHPSRRLLLDPDTGYLYHLDPKVEKWPLLVGMVEEATNSVIRGYSYVMMDFLTRFESEWRGQHPKLKDFLTIYNLEGVKLLQSDDLQTLLEEIVGNSGSEVQVKFMKAYIQIEEDRAVSPSEVLETMKQLLQVTQKVIAREDAASVAALNKLSEYVSRDQKKAARAFLEADQESMSQLDHMALIRFFRSLMPQFKAPELRSLLCYMHLIDLRAEGAFDFKDIIHAVRGIPVHLPKGLLAKSAFKVKTQQASPSPLKGISHCRSSSSGIGRSAGYRLSGSSTGGGSGSSGRSDFGGSDDEGHHHDTSKRIREFCMELHTLKGLKFYLDEENGLMYHPLASGSKGKWPALAGLVVHSESKGKDVAREMTALSKLRLFDELLVKLTHPETRKEIANSFERSAMKVASEGDDISDGERMSPHYVVRFLRKHIKTSEPPDSSAWSLLEGMLSILSKGELLRTSDLSKALEKIKSTQKRLIEGDEDAARVLAKVCRSMSGKDRFTEAAKVCTSHESQEETGCLDLAGVQAVLEDVSHITSSSDKLLAIFHLLFHCPHIKPGFIPIKDIFKAFRAVKLKLPGSLGTVPPGLSLEKLKSGPNAKSLTDSMRARAVWDSGSDAEGSKSPKNVYDVIAISAGEKKRDVTSSGGSQLLKIGWGGNSSSSGGGASYKEGAAMLRSLPRDIMAEAPHIQPQRRVVELSEYRGPNGSPVALDKETGLMYRVSNAESWPELLGQLMYNGKVVTAQGRDVSHIFKALKRISGDERRMMEVFRRFDKDRSNTLELREVMQMCRQMFNMEYNEACFVQAMLDSDLSNTISIEEFMDGIKKSTASLDEVSRTERKVFEVLNQASQRIAQDLDAFWSTFLHLDAEGNGHIDITMTARFFKDLFYGVSGYELRILVAYVFMQDIRKDGLVRPDEVLQYLQAIPMRSPTRIMHYPGFPMKASPHSMQGGSDTLSRTLSGSSRQIEWTLPQQKGSSGGSPFYNAAGNMSGGAYGNNSTFGESTFNSQLPDPRFSVATQDAGRPQTSPPQNMYATSYTQPYNYPQHSPQALPGSAMPITSQQPMMHPGMPMLAAMQTSPGMPPVVGYIIPYEQGVYEQLADERRSSEGGSSRRGRRSRSSSRSRALAAVAAAEQSDSAVYPSDSGEEFFEDEQPLNHPADFNAYRRQRPVTAPVRQGLRSQDSRPYGAPSYYSPQGLGTGYYPEDAMMMPQNNPAAGMRGQRWQVLDGRDNVRMGMNDMKGGDNYSYAQADMMIDEALAAGLDPDLMAEGGGATPFGASRRRSGVGGGAWRSSLDLPAGPMSVLADGSPYSRTTPYGLLQELQKFASTRREAFFNHFMMAASDASSRGRPVGYRGTEPAINEKGLIHKRAVGTVIQRCVPGASDLDIKYATIIIDAALPKHTAISIQDFEYALRQGAAVERLVAAGRLPPQIRGVLSALAEQFYNQKRMRVQTAFRSMDFNRTGMLSTTEQVELMRALAPSLRHSEVLWLATGLHWYGEQQQRDGFLTFEELAEGLVMLARRRGATGEGVGSAEDQGLGFQGGGAGHGQYMLPGGQYQQLQGQGYYGTPYTSPPSPVGPYTSLPSPVGPYMDPYYALQQYGAGGSTPWSPDPQMMGTMMGRDGGAQRSGWSTYGDVNSGLQQQQAMPPRGGGMEAGAAYFAWVQDNRQKVLESWFAKDSASKVKLLEQQQAQLEKEKQLKGATFQLQQDLRKVDMDMADLEKKTLEEREKRKARDEGGEQGSRKFLDLEGITKRVAKAMDDAIHMIRGGGRSSYTEAATQQGTAGTSESSPSSTFLEAASNQTLDDLLQRLSSPRWFREQSLPENIETLQAALATRSSLLQLQRLHHQEMLKMGLDKKFQELDLEEQRHGLELQAQMMHVHLANQTADLQRRLLWDASNYQRQQQQPQLQPQQQQQQRVLEVPPSMMGPAAVASSAAPSTAMQLSPRTWQMEVVPPGGQRYTSSTSNMAAAFASMPSSLAMPPPMVLPGGTCNKSTYYSQVSPPAAAVGGSASQLQYNTSPGQTMMHYSTTAPNSPHMSSPMRAPQEMVPSPVSD
ncbi:hypothetical protein CEUSTIGMA_g4548.t1 [Chlamydomonas eustigma]|uniref:EF-hand domain-containing protein n=1 Tax=Chlamydomonas eustigma TaxID=1157962 RepID=A0A250X2I1_9CHLO|nr:hypothetical protein CEUSTIGMA_g4548.t1 [Chlamydomonas eustigma]|eukprot:GAX77102.1 hypothetical protein CEUSTIGMA_g4548.t1 [Chlamydomonas eustigma]